MFSSVHCFLLCISFYFCFVHLRLVLFRFHLGLVSFVVSLVEPITLWLVFK